MELQERLEELEASGFGVVAISYDTEAVLSQFATRRDIAFPLLSDDDSAIIRAFGIFNTVAEEGLGENAEDPAVKADVAQYVSAFGASQRVVGTPFPGTFIVDREGRVTSRFFEDFYRERNTTASIMIRLGTNMNPVAGVSGETPHLRITASQSNPDITVGTRFSLILDIEPKANMHVYAPGAEQLGYRVINLKMAEESFARALPVEFPTHEIYHFKPLDEHVPVYQKPFRLIQDIVIAGTPDIEEIMKELEPVTFTGQLEYQACNDTLCFDPVSVPLSWTLTPTPLDRQRATR